MWNEIKVYVLVLYSVREVITAGVFSFQMRVTQVSVESVMDYLSQVS